MCADGDVAEPIGSEMPQQREPMLRSLLVIAPLIAPRILVQQFTISPRAGGKSPGWVLGAHGVRNDRVWPLRASSF